MAQSTAARLSISDIRASMKRVRTEGEKLVDRLGKDARKFVARAQVKSLDDARRRAQEVVRELEAQGDRVRRTVTEQAETLVATIRRVLDIASAVDVTGLTRRVSHLEHLHTEKEVHKLTERVAELERRLERVTKTQAA